MFLSNPRRILLLPAFIAVFLHGCSSSTTRPDQRISSGTANAGRPFPTKEPDVYQGELVISDGTTEEHYFAARKQDKWRFDVLSGGAPSLTQLRSDKVYMIDHAKKAYAVEAYADLKDFDTSYFNSLSLQFFRGANYIDYEEIGRDGNLVRYRAKTLKDSKSDVIVTVDGSNGMMVRQEIASQKEKTDQGTAVNYVFEVRNLKLDVDDSMFDIPAGFHQVAQLADLPRPTIKK